MAPTTEIFLIYHFLLVKLVVARFYQLHPGYIVITNKLGKLFKDGEAYCLYSVFSLYLLGYWKHFEFNAYDHDLAQILGCYTENTMNFFRLLFDCVLCYFCGLDILSLCLINLTSQFVVDMKKCYTEDVKLKSAENVKDTEVKEISSGGRSEKADETSKPKSNNAKSAAAEQDLDVFLLGDLEDSDDGPGTLNSFLIILSISHS